MLIGASNRVLVHCRRGLGRVGMISAWLLVELGANADDAISAVRRGRVVRTGLGRPYATLQHLQELVSSSAPARVEAFALAQPRAEIRGSGYVVESLNAALWAVSRTTTFRDAVLLAVNFGRNADTTGSVTGEIAGPLDGAS